MPPGGSLWSTTAPFSLETNEIGVVKSMSEVERDVMEYEVAIVGGGPAGLACAIRLKQLAPEKTVCVLEKAASMGAHSLSGAVIEPGPLEKLLPEWSTEYTGMKVPAGEDDFRVLTPKGSFKPIPNFLVKLLPNSMTAGTPVNNHGNYIISLGQLTPWLAAKAEGMGVDDFTGFAASEAVFDESGKVKGIRIGDMGLNRDGTPGPNYAPGVEIHAGVMDYNDTDSMQRMVDIGATHIFTAPWDVYNPLASLQAKLDAVKKFGDTVIVKLGK